MRVVCKYIPHLTLTTVTAGCNILILLTFLSQARLVFCSANVGDAHTHLRTQTQNAIAAKHNVIWQQILQMSFWRRERMTGFILSYTLNHRLLFRACRVVYRSCRASKHVRCCTPAAFLIVECHTVCPRKERDRCELWLPRCSLRAETINPLPSFWPSF